MVTDFQSCQFLGQISLFLADDRQLVDAPVQSLEEFEHGALHTRHERQKLQMTDFYAFSWHGSIYFSDPP